MQDTAAYIVVAIKPAFERRARDGGIDDQGQAVEQQVAAGGIVPPVLPIGAAGAYFSRPFVLRAYSQDERIVDALITGPADAEANIASLFARGEVAFILARFAAYGCYACRIERRT